MTSYYKLSLKFMILVLRVLYFLLLDNRITDHREDKMKTTIGDDILGLIIDMTRYQGEE